MSIIATALKHLIAAGVSGDDLVRAVAEMEENAPAPIIVPPGPTKGALRTRAYRERHKASQSVTCDAGNVTSSQSVTDPAPSPLPLLSPHTPQITPSPLPHPDNTPRKDRIFVCPADVDPQHWADFLANRKRKRLASTVTAYRAQLKALAALSDDEWPPGRIIEFAAQRGWGALFDPRQSREHQRNGARNGTDGTGRDGLGVTTRAAFAFLGDGSA